MQHAFNIRQTHDTDIGEFHIQEFHVKHKVKFTHPGEFHIQEFHVKHKVKFTHPIA